LLLLISSFLASLQADTFLYALLGDGQPEERRLNTKARCMVDTQEAHIDI
jgi:hypothetical protein